LPGVGAVIAVVVIGLLVAFLVSVRIEVAQQRRAVETARARLASAKILRRAEGASVLVIQQAGSSIRQVARKATCALTADGLTCLSEDGRWGARARFAPGAPAIGDVAIAVAPALVKGGAAAGGELPAWIAAALPSLPPDGVILQLQIGLTWLVAVPEPEAWFADLSRAFGGPAAAAPG
jgi:hypothetical protein